MISDMGGRGGKRGAVIFDLDGTLVDSAPDLLDAMNRLLTEQGRHPIALDQIVPMIGDGIPALVRRALGATGAVPRQAPLQDLTDRFVEIYLDPARPQLTRVYDDVSATLARLRADSFLLAVCTNKIERAAVQLLDALGLASSFDAIVGGDTVPASKPDPAHVLAALSRLGAGAECAVTVGDSSNDMAAGAAAGTAVVAVSYGYGDVRALTPRPDRVIERFADLPGALAEIAADRAAMPGRPSRRCR